MIARLELRILELEARLARDSDNSSQPPSSDPPWKKPEERRGGRKRGGQPGHRGHRRERLEPTEVVDLKPPSCSGCGSALAGSNERPSLHQVVEIPEISARVTEYRFHSLSCASCGVVTGAEWPAEIPRGAFGPRLQAMVSTCSGAFHLSKRNTQELLRDFFGVQLALGTICNLERATSRALEPAYAEAVASIRTAQRANADETGWRERAGRCFLWTVSTPRVTFFAIRKNRSQEVARELLKGFPGILGTDGYNAYHYISGARRQFCWAHLIRQFRGLLLYDEEAQQLGTKLLSVAERVFTLWHRRRRKPRRKRVYLLAQMAPLRHELNVLLSHGASLSCRKASGMCRTLLRYEPSLWVFLGSKSVEPTNNAAERALRPAVLWRKGSFGTDSPDGSHFVERILTAVASLRARAANVFQFLVTTCVAALTGRQAPSLLEA